MTTAGCEVSTVSLDIAVTTRCRELLGEEAAGLSDTEVDAIRRHADTMARVIVDLFVKQSKA